MSDITKQAELELEEDIRVEEASREIQVVEETIPASKTENTIHMGSQTDSLLAMAVEKDFDADKLEKLIQLKNQEEARFAKKVFSENFIKMQNEMPAIKRGNVVHDKHGKQLYKFAAIEDILNREVKGILAKHGFSYDWEQEDFEKEIKITCVISGWGHEKRTSMQGPALISQSSGGVNILQQKAMSITYMKRYTLCNALGIIIENEDNDGIIDFGQQFIAEVENIKKIDSEAMLNEFYKDLRRRGLGSGEMSFLYSLLKERRKEIREATDATGN